MGRGGPRRHLLGALREADAQAERLRRRVGGARRQYAHERVVQGDLRVVRRDPAQAAQDLEADPAVSLHGQVPLQHHRRRLGREAADGPRDVLADARGTARIGERPVERIERFIALRAQRLPRRLPRVADPEPSHERGKEGGAGGLRHRASDVGGHARVRRIREQEEEAARIPAPAAARWPGPPRYACPGKARRPARAARATPPPRPFRMRSARRAPWRARAGSGPAKPPAALPRPVARSSVRRAPPPGSRHPRCSSADRRRGSSRRGRSGPAGRVRAGPPAGRDG